MECIANKIPYRQTGYFNKIVVDYIDQADALKPFHSHPPSLAGLKKTMDERKNGKYDRKILVEELKKQYEILPENKQVNSNIDLLLSPKTFTITTAHQTNIFTGPLYFIYKILHAIKLAASCKSSFPDYNFVPVFYVGSEDADIDELNHIHLGGEKLVWNTKQSGAVGRMKIDKELIRIIDLMEGQLSVQDHGKEITGLIKDCYKTGDTIQHATFKFIHALFAQMGLVVLLPDNAAFKKQMLDVFRDDLLNQTASGIIEKSAVELSNAGYKVQANPREINLFYLKDDIRERIERKVEVEDKVEDEDKDKVEDEDKDKVEDEDKDKVEEYLVLNTKIRFSKEELLSELANHPERFSPNVILRGIYQETILPNIAFIGGGGETAYWLQLKELFTHYEVPFPVLVLRNSFLIVEKKWQEKIARLGLEQDDFFLSQEELLNKLVARDTKNEMKLNGALNELEQLYDHFKKLAAAVDTTLSKHVDNLKIKTVKKLQELEKKMLRAEKRKFEAQQRQIRTIKENLFPGNGLQERHDNISYYYAKWGKEFIQNLFENSLTLESEFVTLTEK